MVVLKQIQFKTIWILESKENQDIYKKGKQSSIHNTQTNTGDDSDTVTDNDEGMW